ncbi:PREDICTED: uncharacterized protein LOC109212363 [Nicotiana attenuata]|uniref:uncharacterized protein LOC109212363 n=1 Tax=Nicotiana attenuata TaxID=49451 RepID=UPI000905D0B5|nr:PREDICTED: uncharacterized protein LOC109212363 [Nicotiana attenuata]
MSQHTLDPTLIDTSIPPKPPDPLIEVRSLADERLPSFKDKLLSPDPINFFHGQHVSSFPITNDFHEAMPATPLQDDPTPRDHAIVLSSEELQRLYEPWKFSVIIKLFGKRILHQYLKKKLHEHWKPTEQFPLIDLGGQWYSWGSHCSNITSEKQIQ